jgi:CDP-diacylglycerol--glycerol-3-phosphate 3-phosphatidyltransferase
MVAAALVVYFVREGPEWAPIITVLVFMGAAQMVSYIRARAEALGVDCKVGFMSRPERLVGLGIGFLFSWWEPGGTSFLVWWLYFLTLLTVITVVHREVHVLRKLRALEAPPALEEPPAAARESEPLADDLWAEPSGRGGRRY